MKEKKCLHSNGTTVRTSACIPRCIYKGKIVENLPVGHSTIAILRVPPSRDNSRLHARNVGDGASWGAIRNRNPLLLGRSVGLGALAESGALRAVRLVGGDGLGDIGGGGVSSLVVVLEDGGLVVVDTSVGGGGSEGCEDDGGELHFECGVRVVVDGQRV